MTNARLPAKHADIFLRAAGAILSSSEFLRRSALSGDVVVQQLPAADFETVDQLRRIGVNLNQLARVANKTGYMPDGLEEALAKVDQLLDRMIELGSPASVLGEPPFKVQGSIICTIKTP